MRTLVFAVAYLGLCAAVFAQSNIAPGSSSTDNAPMEQKIRDLEDRVIALEGQLRLLKSTQTQPAAPVAGQQQAVTTAQNQSQPVSSVPAPGQTPALAVAQ